MHMTCELQVTQVTHLHARLDHIQREDRDPAGRPAVHARAALGSTGQYRGWTVQGSTRAGQHWAALGSGCRGVRGGGATDAAVSPTPARGPRHELELQGAKRQRGQQGIKVGSAQRGAPPAAA